MSTEEVKQTTLAAILTEQQLNHVVKLCNSAQSDAQLIHELKTYLRSFAAELESKGVVADYLAYWVFAKARGIV